jgi:hypothetical protein
LKLAATRFVRVSALPGAICGAPQHDVVLVAYPGLLDCSPSAPFAWMRSDVPVAWDWFLSGLRHDRARPQAAVAAQSAGAHG